VPGENGGGDGFADQDVERKPHEAIAILLGEISDGGNEAGAGGAEFGAGFGLGVLAHDSAIIGAARFLEGAQSADGAGIVSGTDQDALALGFTQVFANAFQCGLELAVAIDGR